MNGNAVLRATCTVLLITISACDAIFDLDNARPGAESLARSVGRPAWSADSRHIYFTDRRGSQVTTFTLKAVDVTNGRVHGLTTVTGWNTGGEQARTSSDPAVVYFAISSSTLAGYTIYRAPSAGGTAEIVAINAGWPWFVISSSGNRLAFTSQNFLSDSIHIVTLSVTTPPQKRTLRAAAPNPNVIALSPDGGAVVYSASGGFYSTDVSMATHRALFRPPRDSLFAIAPQVMWNGTTPHLLVAGTDTSRTRRAIRVEDVDGSDGARTVAGTIPEALMVPWSLARSVDGRSFAAWVPVELVRESVERSTYRFRLYVHTPALGTRIELEWTADEGLPWLEFSPDGRRIGLVLYGELFVVQL